jgi:hypothetical protein
MLKQLAGILAVVALSGACREADRETGAMDDRAGVDTMVESETIKDTTVVEADTNIDVDTTKETDHVESDSQ